MQLAIHGLLHFFINKKILKILSSDSTRPILKNLKEYGYYAKYLSKYSKTISKNNLLLLDFNFLTNNTQEAFDIVCGFLNIHNIVLNKEQVSKPINVGAKSNIELSRRYIISKISNEFDKKNQRFYIKTSRSYLNILTIKLLNKLFFNLIKILKPKNVIVKESIKNKIRMLYFDDQEKFKEFQNNKMIRLFKSNKLLTFNFIFFLVFIYFLSDIAQWREDQATNYWLGYYFSINEIPIGLVSSRTIPNPNGMVLIGKFLGQIPTFRLSVFVYASIQSLLVLFFVKFLNVKDTVLEALLFSSIVLNVFFLYSVSELWSQYLSISLNFFVLGILFYFVKTEKPINILTLINLLLLLPTIYLSGFLNSFCLFLVIIFLLYKGEMSLYFKLNL